MRVSRGIIAGSSVALIGIVAMVWLLRAVNSSGAASDFESLRSVYGSASPTLADFHRSTILKDFPFVGPISWQRVSIRPTVHLTGRVDVVAFQSFLVSHLSIQEHLTLDTNGVTNTINFSLSEGRVVTQGKVDMVRSGARLFSTILENKDRPQR